MLRRLQAWSICILRSAASDVLRLEDSYKSRVKKPSSERHSAVRTPSRRTIRKRYCPHYEQKAHQHSSYVKVVVCRTCKSVRSLKPRLSPITFHIVKRLELGGTMQALVWILLPSPSPILLGSVRSSIENVAHIFASIRQEPTEE